MGAAAAVHPSDQTLSAYGLGKLDDASAESVDKHLESCLDCQRRVAELSSDEFLGRLQNAQVRSDKSAAGWSRSGKSSTEGARGPVVPPSPVDTLPPELADHPDYELVRELGRGGMGVVYLVRNKLMGRLEVLKVVSGHLIERPGVRDRFGNAGHGSYRGRSTATEDRRGWGGMGEPDRNQKRRAIDRGGDTETSGAEAKIRRAA
jgi:Putative zinc-finger